MNHEENESSFASDKNSSTSASIEESAKKGLDNMRIRPGEMFTCPINQN